MKVTKWVEFSQEVEIDISADDVRCALSEAFARVNVRNVDDTPNRFDVSRALNSIGTFLNALTDEHISLLSPKGRQTVAAFLGKHAERFSATSEPAEAEKRAIEREDANA
jgi:mitochondrial fission protein ELM1